MLEVLAFLFDPLAIGGAAAGLLALLAKFFPSQASGAWQFLTAAVAALPGVITALGQFLKFIGESAVMSLLFGVFVGGLVGLVYGWSWDAPLRAKAKAAAISAANERADVAIAAIKRDYEKRLAEIQRRQQRTSAR